MLQVAFPTDSGLGLEALTAPAEPGELASHSGAPTGFFR